MIELKKVSKEYHLGQNVVKALDDVSIKVSKAEFLSVVGPSGSGKSTMLNMMGGIDRPSKGNVIIDGEELSEYDDEQLSEFRFNKIGFVFQSFNLIPTLTALENVTLPTLPYYSNSKKRGKKLLKMVGLGERMDHLPTQLSGGQKQRVAIARALINNPQLLLADEPTGNLDSKTGEDIVKLLKELNDKEKTTMIIVTHDINIAEKTKRIIHLKDGKISWDKPANDVKLKEFLR